MTELSENDEAVVEHVVKDFHAAKKRHEPFRKNSERRYRLYRSFQEMRRRYAREPRDRDELLRSAKREWGAELFIPYSFSAVETILPRMVTALPEMNVTPATPDSDDNVDNVKMMIERQSDQIDYPVNVLQPVGKSGLIYGLGVQKTYWKTEWHEAPTLKRPTVQVAGGDDWIVSQATKRKSFDDPWAEPVDIFDFFWDPYASDLASAEYVIHRTWRSERYIRRMVETGVWNEAVPIDELLSGGPVTQRDTIWRARDEAGGFSSEQRLEGHLHEVWEYHDGTNVYTVLDGKYPVQIGANPYWHGEKPFQIYRPSVVPHEFAGIGVIEPIEDLQQEMNTLRSQRRDNATLKLQQVFAYFEGMVDPDHLKFGPGMAIPVNGSPQDLLQPINVGDIPNSGYQEETNLMADIMRTTGVNDQQEGVSNLGGAQTATGAQLVQAAANVNIQQKTLLLEVQVVAPTCRQFCKLNQQKIRKVRPVAGPPKPDGPDARWSWFDIGPAELAGEFRFQCVGGSSQPDNIPQLRSDGQDLFNMFAGNQLVDQVQLFEMVLKKLGVRNPAPLILKQPPPGPPGAPPGPGLPPGAPGPPGAPPGPPGAPPGGPAPPPGLVLPSNALSLIVQGLVSTGKFHPQDAEHLVMGAIAHARQVDAGQLPPPGSPQPQAP